ncbi:MAG TPA: hypothetical protein VHB77_04535, partial [Planctomycetaceae bacterium]|nr:hypothetical protein [Planctomycetaceae bacterium]
MAQDPLLNELTSLPYAARFRRLREVGLEARTNPKIAGVLDRWERGDWQERMFSVQACTGSDDAARLQRMIDDPSRTVSSLALKLLAVHGSDDVLVEVLTKLTYRRRIRLLARLRALRRRAVIDRFLDAGFDAALPRMAESLSFGSSEAVRRHFAQAETSGGSLFWERMSRHHPRIAAETVLDRLDATAEPDALVLRHAWNVVLLAARREPDRVVSLVRSLSRSTPLNHWSPSRELYSRANELAAIMLESDGAAVSLTPVGQRLENSLRLRLLREQPGALPIEANWFRRIPATERGEIFQEVGRS